MHSFHFLRPTWFLVLIPLAVILTLAWQRRGADNSWQRVVEPRLLSHLLIGGGQGRSAWGTIALTLGALLAVTALAGPAWNKLQQPVFRRESALVVLLDLSRSMDAADLQPSRLQMAKFKLRDILARRKEGDAALVVYAADPFVVTPLTNDVDTIARQLPTLTTELMPAQGSRADRAIVKAQALLQQAGAVRGNVLLITDGIENDSPMSLHEAVEKLVAAGYRLSVLGVGTTAGAPIPLPDGGFFKDAGGAILLPKLDDGSLTDLAAEGHGIYRRLAVGGSDTDDLMHTFDSGWRSQQSQQVSGVMSDQWRDAGPWLLLPLLPLAALVFRRGYLLVLCLVVLLPMPNSAYAFGWQDLWQTPDQRGAQALAARQAQQAASLFKDPQWRATALYRAGDYLAAVKELARQRSAVADYNRGNALAHLGKYQEALSAYEDTLKRDPNFKDAAFNLDLVKKWLQSTPSQSASDGKQQQKNQQSMAQQSQQRGQQQVGKNTDQHKGTDQQGESSKDKDITANSVTPQEGSGQTKASPQRQAANQSFGHRNGAIDKTKSGDAHDQQDELRDKQSDLDNSQTLGEGVQPQSESEQADAQWLRRIPDDPGGLWRRKFLYQYKREYQSQQGEAKPW